jgi:hypothetical protein
MLGIVASVGDAIINPTLLVLIGQGAGGEGRRDTDARGAAHFYPLHTLHPQKLSYTHIYIHLYTPPPQHPILLNVQLLNRRNGDEGLGCFPIFKPRFNELAGELLTRYCT